MTSTFVDASSESLVSEFIPTDVRFYAECNTNALKALVVRLAAISAKNSLVSGTELLKIDSVEPSAVTESFLQMYSTNGSIFMRSQFHGSTVRKGGTVYVPAQKMASVLKLVKGENVTLSCTGFEMQVSSGNSMWRIKLPTEQKMPEYPGAEDPTFGIPSGELQRILNAVSRAAADGHSRASLTQVRIGDGYAISCDGARMHRIHSDYLKDVKLFTLPTLGSKLFSALLRATPDDTEVGLAVNPSAVSLITTTDEISILRSKVGFPDVEKVFISQSILNDSEAVVERAQLRDAVTQVRVFADEVLSGVSLTATTKAGDKRAIVVHAKDEVGNFSSTEVQATVTGKVMVDLKVNYKQLQDALDSVESDLVTIRVAKSTKSAKTSAFIEDLENGFVAVIGQIIKEN